MLFPSDKYYLDDNDFAVLPVAMKEIPDCRIKANFFANFFLPRIRRMQHQQQHPTACDSQLPESWKTSQPVTFSSSSSLQRVFHACLCSKRNCFVSTFPNSLDDVPPLQRKRRYTVARTHTERKRTSNSKLQATLERAHVRASISKKEEI